MERWEWQAEALRVMVAAVAADPVIGEIWTCGSADPHELDEWDDLDVVLVAESSETGHIARPEWVGFPAPVWAYQEGSGTYQRGKGIRVVCDDGRRIGVSVVSTSAEIHDARRVDIPASAGEGVRPATGPRPPAPPEANEFRFVAAHAVAEAARNDLLLGGHLALELPRMCLLLAVRLRDGGLASPEAGGESWNDVLERALDVVPDTATDQADILDLVDASAGLFDDLAGMAWPEYVPDWSGLTALLDRARSGVRPVPVPS